MDLKIESDMSEQKKFKVGDRVMCTDNGALGVITSIDIDPIGVCDGYTVLFDDGEETWVCADMVVLSDEPIYDPKTAFLSELKGLLTKYDASIIGGGFEGYGDYLQIQLKMDEPFDVGESEYGDRCILTADNITDYDKE